MNDYEKLGRTINSMKREGNVVAAIAVPKNRLMRLLYLPMLIIRLMG